MIGIYLIKNNLTSEEYVGKSVNIKKRWSDHISQSRKDVPELLIDRVIKKYGVENFEFIILEICDKSQLCERERYWINKLDTYNKGYNCTLGGDGAGHKQSEETRQKISNFFKGKPKKSHPAWNKGIKCPNISASKIGKPRTKQKWMTPDGEIKYMNISHVKQHHPDWKEIE